MSFMTSSPAASSSASHFPDSREACEVWLKSTSNPSSPMNSTPVNAVEPGVCATAIPSWHGTPATSNEASPRNSMSLELELVS